MKLKLILAGIVLVLTIVIAVLISVLVSTNKKASRFKQNYETVLKDKSVQQQLTYNEFKYLYEGYVEQLKNLKEYGVKLRNVENLIHISYNIKDSLVYRDTLIYVYDTVDLDYSADFNIQGNCWEISGTVCNNTIEVNHFESNDSILILLYKEKKKCLFEPRKVKAIAYSYCTGDTLGVLNNLRIGKAK